MPFRYHPFHKRKGVPRDVPTHDEERGRELLLRQEFQHPRRCSGMGTIIEREDQPTSLPCIMGIEPPMVSCFRLWRARVDGNLVCGCRCGDGRSCQCLAEVRGTRGHRAVLWGLVFRPLLGPACWQRASDVGMAAQKLRNDDEQNGESICVHPWRTAKRDGLGGKNLSYIHVLHPDSVGNWPRRGPRRRVVCAFGRGSPATRRALP